MENRIERESREIKDVLRNNVCKIAFVKKGKDAGSVRLMLGTLKAEYLQKRIAPSTGKKKARKKPVDQIVCFDIEKNSFRSFKLDAILSFDKIDAIVYNRTAVQ